MDYLGTDFFFSSRRRHTIFDCDWSSDVCSSDLAEGHEIEIRDDKHDADLRSVVDWGVSGDGKWLTIRLKPRVSDFGSSNAIRICVGQIGRASCRERE